MVPGQIISLAAGWQTRHHPVTNDNRHKRFAQHIGGPDASREPPPCPRRAAGGILSDHSILFSTSNAFCAILSWNAANSSAVCFDLRN